MSSLSRSTASLERLQTYRRAHKLVNAVEEFGPYSVTTAALNTDERETTAGGDWGFQTAYKIETLRLDDRLMPRKAEASNHPADRPFFVSRVPEELKQVRIVWERPGDLSMTLPRKQRIRSKAGESLALCHHLGGGVRYNGWRRRRHRSATESLSLRWESGMTPSRSRSVRDKSCQVVSKSRLLALDHSEGNSADLHRLRKLASTESADHNVHYRQHLEQRRRLFGSRALREEVRRFQRDLKHIDWGRRLTSAQLGMASV